MGSIWRHLLIFWLSGRGFSHIFYIILFVSQLLSFWKFEEHTWFFEEKPTHHVLFNETWTSVFWIKKQAHTITVFNEHLTFTNSRSTVPSAAILYLVHPRIFYIYRRLRGINREIGFGFVSCSCRACVRAGEEKLRGRVRRVSSQRWCLWRWDVLLLLRLRHRFSLCVFATIHKGSKENHAHLLLYTRVLRNI